MKKVESAAESETSTAPKSPVDKVKEDEDNTVKVSTKSEESVPLASITQQQSDQNGMFTSLIYKMFIYIYIYKLFIR